MRMGTSTWSMRLRTRLDERWPCDGWTNRIMNVLDCGCRKEKGMDIGNGELMRIVVPFVDPGHTLRDYWALHTTYLYSVSRLHLIDLTGLAWDAYMYRKHRIRLFYLHFFFLSSSSCILAHGTLLESGSGFELHL